MKERETNEETRIAVRTIRDFGVKACSSLSKSFPKVSQPHTTTRGIDNHARSPFCHKHPLLYVRGPRSRIQLFGTRSSFVLISERNSLRACTQVMITQQLERQTRLIIIIVSVGQIVCWMNEAFGLSVDYMVDQRE